MLQVYRVPIEVASLLFPLLAILLLVPICVAHYRRYGYLNPKGALAFYSFLFYSLCAYCLVIFPLPSIGSNFCQLHDFRHQLQLIPFHFIDDLIRTNKLAIAHVNLISILVSPAALVTFFNVLLLLPLGFYLRYYFQAGRNTTILIAFFTSLSFEVTQLTGIYGLYPCQYRLFDVDDLMCNTAGALLGYSIQPFFAFLPSLNPARQSRTTIVSPFRRFVAFAIDWFLINTLTRCLFLLFWQQSLSTYPAWLDLSGYFIWFVLAPFIWQGQTVGKALVMIRLTGHTHKPVRLLQLCWRYGILIYLPVATELILKSVADASDQQLGRDTAIAFTFIWLLPLLELLCLYASMLFRGDRRAWHDLLAQTNSIAIQPTAMEQARGA
ncbi:MAG: VanZ family protein [Cyanobacteria bacterium P01_H01_bin.121]